MNDEVQKLCKHIKSSLIRIKTNIDDIDQQVKQLNLLIMNSCDHDLRKEYPCHRYGESYQVCTKCGYVSY